MEDVMIGELTMASMGADREGIFARCAVPVTKFELLLTLENAYSSSNTDYGHMIKVLMAHHKLRSWETVALHT